MKSEYSSSFSTSYLSKVRQLIFPNLFTIFLQILLFSLVCSEPDHVIFILKRGGTQCFRITTPGNDRISGEVRVTNGEGDMNVGFWVVVGDTNQILVSKSNVEHEKFSVLTPKGPHHGHDGVSVPSDYKLCVFNREALKPGKSFTTRKVFVKFETTSHSAAGDDDGATNVGQASRGIARQKDVNDMRAIINEIERYLHNLRQEIDEIRDREQSLFQLTSNASWQISLMSILSCLAITAAGVFQISQFQGELQSLGKLLFSGNPKRKRKKLHRTGSMVLPNPLESMGRLSLRKDESSMSLPSHVGLSRAASSPALPRVTRLGDK